MEQLTQQTPNTFVDRRANGGQGSPQGIERRQFSDSRDHMHPDAVELAQAVDQYKLQHRRRFITFEELHKVITSLGYHK